MIANYQEEKKAYNEWAADETKKKMDAKKAKEEKKAAKLARKEKKIAKLAKMDAAAEAEGGESMALPRRRPFGESEAASSARSPSLDPKKAECKAKAAKAAGKGKAEAAKDPSPKAHKAAAPSRKRKAEAAKDATP